MGKLYMGWNYWVCLVLISIVVCLVRSRQLNGDVAVAVPSINEIEGKRWAVLVAGSRGYENYRHQADICHAYQTLRKGGLEEENIIVFMYDDIAFNVYNPRPGIIINHPLGPDVYQAVPKDYTGEEVNVHNLLAVILGNRTAVKGGSGKVLETGPHDRIFIFYADHGSTGCVGMPTGDDLYANDLIDVLKEKQAAKSFRSMVVYVEACESGSMFQGLLPNNTNIYAVTAANADENSWATYCPDSYPSPPSDYTTCLGDLFSISWLEDSDMHDLKKEDLEKQYRVVKRRTSAESDNVDTGSHVTQFGNLQLRNDPVFSYLGSNPANDNYGPASPSLSHRRASTDTSLTSQWHAALLHLFNQFYGAPEGSDARTQAGQKLAHELGHRRRIDHSIQSIKNALQLVHSPKTPVPSPGEDQAIVQDWTCFRQLVTSFKKFCGTTTSRYEMKYFRVFAKLCNVRVDVQKATVTIEQVCLSSARFIPDAIIHL